MIDARQLHAWLKVSTPMHKWIARRVEEYGFEEGSDFRTNVSKTGGRPRTDYLLTVDMAKELSMVERTERGRATRRYFIQMEKAANQMAVEMTQAGMEAPDAFFDARAEFLGFKQEIVELLKERLPEPKKPTSLPKAAMTAGRGR